MKPLVNKKYKLEKFAGKGGWTYARIPEIAQNKTNPFGWIKVRVIIDGYEVKKTRLMPMGNGLLFLPVKAEVRKKISRREGDLVHIILYPDNEPLEVPEEMLQCLKDEEKAFTFFNSLSESERKYYIDWVYAAKKEETRINRLVKTINRLALGRKMYEKDNTKQD